MPHINYRRKEAYNRRKCLNSKYRFYNYPSVPNNQKFRSKERHCLQRLRAGDDPDSIIWPTSRHHGDNIWNYD